MLGNHSYIYSGQSALLKSEEKTKVTTGDKEASLTAVVRDWSSAGDWCQERCMDLVSIETREENEFVKKRMINGLIRFFWTSGRKCNFEGCDREDLQPPIVNGECDV